MWRCCIRRSRAVKQNQKNGVVLSLGFVLPHNRGKRENEKNNSAKPFCGVYNGIPVPSMPRLGRHRLALTHGAGEPEDQEHQHMQRDDIEEDH